MTDAWKAIEENYETARRCFYNLNNESPWTRDEFGGKRHLLEAYCDAKDQKEKIHLLYARILMMMYREYGYFYGSKLKDFVSPALKEYKLAIKEGAEISERELKGVEDAHKYEQFLYDQIIDYNHSNPDEQFKAQCELIEGFNKIGVKKLGFHDFEITSFKIEDETAEMILEDSFKLRFEDVDTIHADFDIHDIIFDMTCYKQYWNDYYVFDVGLYKIVCKKISVEEIKK